MRMGGLAWLVAGLGTVAELAIRDFSQYNTAATVGMVVGILFRWVVGVYAVTRVAARFGKQERPKP